MGFGVGSMLEFGIRAIVLAELILLHLCWLHESYVGMTTLHRRTLLINALEAVFRNLECLCAVLLPYFDSRAKN